MPAHHSDCDSGRVPLAGSAATIGAMRVVFVAAECEPWAKAGGLGDVVDALARALGRLPGVLDEPVDVFIPRYRSIRVPAGGGEARRVAVPVPERGVVANVGVVDVPGDGYRLRLVDHPPAFDRDGLYGNARGDYPDNAWRFGLFCRAALETLRAEGRRPDVLHVHDWHTTPVVIFRDAWYESDAVVGPAAAVHTIHNLAYHGWVPANRLGQLGLRPGDGVVPADADGLDLLAAGIERAEIANTVSPGYAREVLTPGYGMGLDELLRDKGDRFLGILNGLDTALWDPATDPIVAATYDRSDRGGKAACRSDLLERVGLDPADTRPVLGMIGRLDPQKGFDLVAAAAPGVIRAGGRIVLLGSGDPRIGASLRRTAAAHPGRLAFVESFDRELARRIYAGADLILMPSRFEPCGQGQMIALRYGTPPVVRRTGGLADTVVDANEHPGEGTGFVFDEATAEALLAACERAMGVFGDPDRSTWEGIVERGMVVDFDWARRSAPRYVEAYRRAIELRRWIG